MPSAIAYDPAFVLGSIGPEARLQTIRQMANVVATTRCDALEAALNASIAMRRSIDMTIAEPVEMKIDPGVDLPKTQAEISQPIISAAQAHAEAKVDRETQITPLREGPAGRCADGKPDRRRQDRHERHRRDRRHRTARRNAGGPP